MEYYSLVKHAHLLAAVLILGGFLAHSLMLFRAGRRGDTQVLARKLRVTRCYSMPAIGLVTLSLPFSGAWLAKTVGLPMGASWLLYSSVLFIPLMLVGLFAHNRLGVWQASLNDNNIVAPTRALLICFILMQVLLLAIFGLMGAKPA